MTVLEGVFAICRLPADVNASPVVPGWIGGIFWSITHTADELSLICLEEMVPEGVLREGGYMVLKVLGPLSFSLTGIMAGISSTLADAGISIFALSTYDTDYILIKADQKDMAVEALQKRGIIFV